MRTRYIVFIAVGASIALAANVLLRRPQAPRLPAPTASDELTQVDDEILLLARRQRIAVLSTPAGVERCLVTRHPVEKLWSTTLHCDSQSFFLDRWLWDDDQVPMNRQIPPYFGTKRAADEVSAQIVEDANLRHIYEDFNKEWFDNKLPRPLIIGWNPRLEQEKMVASSWFVLGKPNGIYISPRYKDCENCVAMAIFHEMCHVKVYALMGYSHRYPDHGPAWQREMQSLAKKGAFNEYW